MTKKITDYLLNWPLSGARRQAWARQRVVTIVLIMALTTIVVLAQIDRELRILIPTALVILIIYQLYLMLARQTRLQLLSRERQAAHRQADKAKEELLTYANQLENKQKNGTEI